MIWNFTQVEVGVVGDVDGRGVGGHGAVGHVQAVVGRQGVRHVHHHVACLDVVVQKHFPVPYFSFLTRVTVLSVLPQEGEVDLVVGVGVGVGAPHGLVEGLDAAVQGVGTVVGL